MARLNATVWVKAEDGVNYVPFGPESTDIPDWALEQIGDHALDPDDESEDGDVDYSASTWTKKKLEAEVERRNAEKAAGGLELIEVEAPGNKGELIAALEADDDA